jgi:hypothetical protein
VAELADAQGLGPCVLQDVEVRVLSLALYYMIIAKFFSEFTKLLLIYDSFQTRLIAEHCKDICEIPVQSTL